MKDSSGSVVAQVDLKKDSQTAGKQGGHKYHTGTGEMCIRDRTSTAAGSRVP